MRDLEFLPPWYPALLNRRRAVIAQGWFTAAALIVLVLCLFVRQQSIHAAEHKRDRVHDQLGQAASELQKLNELQSLKAQMSRQAEIVSHLGPHIPTARLVNVIDELMPREMALLDLSIESEVQTTMQQPQQAAAPAPGSPAPGAVPVIDRRLNVKLHGVAPSDAQLGVFFTRLQGLPHLSNMQSHCKDRAAGDHVMRDFEVTFLIHLDEEDH